MAAKLSSSSSSSILTFLPFILMAIIISQSSSARTISHTSPSHNHHQYLHQHHKIRFLMQDILTNVTHPSSKPATNKLKSQPLPFSKPLGMFPPDNGIPLTQYNNNPSTTSTKTLDISSIGGLFFPARAALQELEFGAVTSFDEDLFEAHHDSSGLKKFGRAQGVCVASPKNGTNHMVAITATFAGNDQFKDGLSLFGVHQWRSADESHVTVIGGTGRFLNANGYATIKAIDVINWSNVPGEEKGAKKLLLFSVYVS